MLRTILKEVKEFKRASIATPIYMILEVLMEMIIPFLMASIIDQGVNAGVVIQYLSSSSSDLPAIQDLSAAEVCS